MTAEGRRIFLTLRIDFLNDDPHRPASMAAKSNLVIKEILTAELPSSG